MQTVDAANLAIADAYDKHLYESNAFSYTSPRHLRAAAHLYGLSSVPLKQARVLELGCAGGGNLLPFALSHPEAQIVGVDLSAVQVEQGLSLIQALRLGNMTLHAMSLTDITPDFGQFDYIIAHGVFSWVPHEVRLAILRIVRENLSPCGLAYISYNTYPGWKANDILRDAMLLHAQATPDHADKLLSAKTMLSLLAEGAASQNPLGTALKAAVHQLRQHSDFYVAHEYLETFNTPCYLLEFAELCQQESVLHVGDAEPHLEMAISYGDKVKHHHAQISANQPLIMRQQYLDFAVGRPFRKSLVVHAAQHEHILPDPEPGRIVDLRWAGFFRPDTPQQAVASNMQHFKNHAQRTLATQDPAMLAVISVLSAAWPASLDIMTLLERARPQMHDSPDSDHANRSLLAAMHTLFRLGRLHYGLEADPYQGYDLAAVREHPMLIPGALEILEQRRTPGFGIGLFNLWHDAVQLHLEDAEYWLLRCMDGKRSAAELKGLLRDALHRGQVPDTDGKSLKGQRNLELTVDRILRNTVDLLHRNGLLLQK